MSKHIIPTELNIAPRGKSWLNGQLIDGEHGHPTRQSMENAERSQAIQCTCPSGDGSLQWPCPAHPPKASTLAAPAGAAKPASPTFMTADQGRDWAWNDVREYVGTEGWTVMDSVNFHGFFLYGWNYRGQYELQRTATRTAVMQEILSAAPAAVAVPDGAMGLLEALESMVDVCEGHDFDGAPSDAHMEKARTAISAFRAALAATPAAAAPLPLLVRDIARELGITCTEACLALKPLGNFSTNTAVTAEMMAKLRECFPERVPASEVADARERMTAGRACYFMERFLKEEKLLGPNEQAALHYVIDMLEAAAAPVVTTIPDAAYCALQYVEHALAAIANREELVEGTIERVDTIGKASKRAKAALTRLQAVAHHFNALEESPAAPVPVVLPEPDAAIKEVMDLVSDWGEKSHLSGEAQLDAHNPEATQSEYDYSDFCQKNERTAWTAIESKLRALLAGVSAPAAHNRDTATTNGDKWKLVDGDMREAGDGFITYHAAAYREGLADGSQAQADARDAERYRWLRSRDLETISQGGVFAGMTPQNVILNEEDLDQAVDAAIAAQAAQQGGDKQ